MHRVKLHRSTHTHIYTKTGMQIFKCWKLNRSKALLMVMFQCQFLDFDVVLHLYEVSPLGEIGWRIYETLYTIFVTFFNSTIISKKNPAWANFAVCWTKRKRLSLFQIYEFWDGHYLHHFQSHLNNS